MKLWFTTIAILTSLFCSAQTDELYDPFYYISVLERKTEIQMDSMYTLDFNLKRAKRVMLKERMYKRAWIKVAIGEGVLIGGAALILVSGAWVPVVMGVVAIELFLVVEGHYRLSVRYFKQKQPTRWKM